MSAFTFLHAADIHLDSGFAGLSLVDAETAAALAGATRRALRNLVDATLAEGAAFLLIAGDLYDGAWKDVRSAFYVRAELRRLSEAGVPVFIVKGNHDADSEIADALPLPEGVRVFGSRAAETLRLDALRVAIHGRSFPARSVPEDFARAYPPPVPGWFNIGLLHTSADGRPGHADYAPCTVGALRAAGYDYWALGHVHAREMLSEDPPIAYPGCLQGRHVREAGPKGALRVRVSDGRAQVDFLTLDAARWATAQVDLSAVETEAGRVGAAERALRAALADSEGRTAIVRLRYLGATALDPALRRLGAAALHEEAAALAASLSPALLVESARIDTAPPRATDPARLAPLAPALAEAAADPALRAAVEAEIAELTALPPEARPDGLDAGEIIAEARRLLLARAALDATEA